MKIISKDLFLTLPEKKKNKIVEQCPFLLTKTLLNIRDLTQVIGISTHSRLANNSTVSNYAALAGTGFFHGEIQRKQN